MEFIKKKKDLYKITLSENIEENKECLIEFNNWYCHYGIEKFKSKYIINLNIKDDNSGYNLKNLIKQIYEKINNDSSLKEILKKNIIFFNPIKKNKYKIETVRIELEKSINEDSVIDGPINIKPKTEISGILCISDIWIWDDSYGIKVYLKKIILK